MSVFFLLDLQETLVVSSGGAGIVQLAHDGKPQVFFSGAVADPSSFYIPVRVSEQ